MKSIERIKIVFNRGFKALFAVNDIEKLERLLEVMNDKLDAAKDEKNRTKGIIQEMNGRKTKLKDKLKKIEECNITFAKNNNESKLEEGYEHKLDLERQIAILDDSIKAHKNLLTGLEKQVKIYTKKIRNVKANLEELRSKYEFSENVTSFKKTMHNLDCDNIDDIAIKINQDYNKSNYDLEDIDAENSADDFVNDNDEGYKKYVASLSRKVKRNKKKESE